jgi:mono/diheme cytochrome c family protein
MAVTHGSGKRLLLNRVAGFGAGAVAFGFAGLWILTMPATVPASALPSYQPNLKNGETVFNIGGCASCHAVPSKNPDKVDRTRLGGGLALKTPFGTFYAPNISPDRKDGIGSWTEAEFATALWDGTAPGGRNLYPVFPYPSFRHMRLNDVRDLFAYIKTLPPVRGKVRGPDLVFPFNIRRLVGLWKLLYLRGGPFVPDPTESAQWNRGAYLVNGPGHCAECHSPRNALGAIIASERFTGGPTPNGKDWVPNITGLGSSSPSHARWTKSDVATLLDDGMTPDGDFVGGAMADVVNNTTLLNHADRVAIADYILSLPRRQGQEPPQK